MDWYLDDPRVESFGPIARSTGVPVDAFIFIADALCEAPYYVGDEPNDVIAEARHCTAAEFCRAVPKYARNLFGTQSLTVLREMGLKTSDDLGKLVFAMVDAGFLYARPEDRPEDFQGLCRFVDED